MECMKRLFRQHGIASKAVRWDLGVVYEAKCGIIAGMTRDQVKEILDRVLTWSAERQADAARVVEIMEEQDKSDLRLSDEQVAEVKRRLADPNPKFLTLEQVRERFARRRA
jgi:hypothetical protein